MKLLISPITSASVEIMETGKTRTIGMGLLIYVGISKTDIEKCSTTEFIEKIVHKITHTKFFHSDFTQKIDQSIADIDGEILLISNFTLYGNGDKGTKIDFGNSARFDESKPVYESLVHTLQSTKIIVKTGEFGAKMRIESTNFGPLNYILEF